MAEPNDIANPLKKFVTDTLMQRKRAAIVALCYMYAGKALKMFRDKQARDAYWTNRTFYAYASVFADIFDDGGTNLGFFIAHTAKYGLYLEKANQGKYAALWPIIKALVPRFYRDLNKIYGSSKA